jgi:AraC family transcriptional regulator
VPLNRILYQSQTVSVGQFICPPEDERWRDVNVNGETYVAAFPGTSVVIQHAGRLPVLANPNHVVFYAPGERYKRALHDVRGDRCLFVCLEPDAAPEVLEALGLEADRRLPFAAGPSDADAHIVLRVAVRALLSGTCQLLAVEEAAHYAIARSLAAGASLHRRRRRTRAFTDREHHLLVENAKAVLTDRVSERDSLVTLAQRLSTSPFHLARVFRERTGFSLHGYRTQLRLRLALDRLVDPSVALQVIADDLGFSSHAHFTHAFKETFGLPPSALRSVSDVRALHPRLR